MLTSLSPDATATETVLSPAAAIILPGGRVALVIERSPVALPASGTVDGAGSWTALSWEAERGRSGVALLPSLPPHEARLVTGEGETVARLERPGHLDVTAAPLLRLLRAGECDAASLMSFLQAHAASVSSGLLADFVAKAAEREGFVELVARTECGGLFLQGWAQSVDAETPRIIGIPGHDGRDIAVARFDREDILPPASGFCLFAKCVDPDAPLPQALYVHRDGGLGRLDLVPASEAMLRGAAATGHVRSMLGRLQAPKSTLSAFRRVCRPRYEGEDTLSGHAGPVAAALDRVLRAADGTLLVSGWLLDPLSRVEHMLLKSRANLYAPLHESWTLLPRPDLNHGFSDNPFFAGLLDDRDVMHGFVCHAPARPDQSDGDLYLEIVLDDGTCLFRPVAVTPCQGEGVLPAVLSGLSPDEPELSVIVETHLAPFLAGLGRRVDPLWKIGRPVPLGPGPAGRDVSTVMPIAGIAELQPVFAALAGTSDAEGMDITLVAGRRAAAEIRTALDDAFRFYGLTGNLVVVPDHATIAARLDAGVGSGTAPRILAWQSSALPRGPDWLARLKMEAERLDRGLISPVLLYEDGSVYFSGARPDFGARKASCSRAGFGSHALRQDGVRPVSAGAAEIALVDREVLAASGGFSGHLFGDSHTHLDLARRLRRAGGTAWCAASIAFWMLEDPRPEDRSPFALMTRAVDAALFARRIKEGARP